MSSNMHIQGPQIDQFNNIAPKPIPRSSFVRNFTRKSTLDPDWLVPIFVDEILPGDEVNLRLTAFCRLATPIKPIMDNLYFETFWFFVPNRLVWDNWEKFQGQQTNPGDSVAYTIPKIDKTTTPLSTTGFQPESLWDYFGLPILTDGIDNVSALFTRAYRLIYNEWFRDENLQNSQVIGTGDGPDDASYSANPLKRGNRKDYFTSALPWPQKGNPVTLPLSGTATVTSTGGHIGLQTAIAHDHAGFLIGNTYLDNSGGFGSTGVEMAFKDPTGLQADLSTATSAITINALRQAALYQQILELDARGGTRYVESIYSRFGVISPDFRLQRPELLGQGSTRVNIYSVPQTAPTQTGQTPQGNLAAFGTMVIDGSHGCRYYATEHGMLMGLANVRADLTYQQGVPKMFTRRTRLDFYEPLLNGLGEQAILNREIYAQGTSDDDLVFGYQERFAEYRYKGSEVTGLFRSAAPDSLDVWHLSKEFGSLPLLNDSFITEAVPIDRVIAVTDEPSFLLDCFYNYNHVRPMPVRSNPGITRL